MIDLISEAMGKPVVENLTEIAEIEEVGEYEVQADDLTDDDLVLVDEAV